MMKPASVPRSATSPLVLPSVSMPMLDFVSVEDQFREYCPLPFRGFWEEGYCYLRVRISAGKLVVFCSQLPQYTGTSVTNALEAVLESLVIHLMHEGPQGQRPALHVASRFGWWRRLLQSDAQWQAQRLRTAIAHVQRNCLWIEHYFASDSIARDETFALVTFNEAGAPAWHYVARSAAEQEVGDPSFLALTFEEAARWASNTRR